MEFSAFKVILGFSVLMISISTTHGGQNSVYNNERHGLAHMLNRRMSRHISKRSTTNVVDISMFTDSSAPGKSFSVYVDSTMTRLIVEVKVERSSPVVMLAKPSGLPGPHPKLNGTASAGTVTATIDVAITSADYGIWKLTKLDANTWNVKVQGESSLDFTYQFLSGSFIQVPLTGEPIQGESYKTVLTVADYTKAKSVDVVQLFIKEKSTPVNMMFPLDKGSGKYEVPKLTMLNQDFMIGINGKDNSGHFFRRVKTIHPIALSLSVPTFLDSSIKLYENKKLDLVFYVKNELSKEQDIDVRIQDTQGFAETPKIISATLKPGQNYSGKFVITGGLFGVSTDVTISAKPYIPGTKSDGPSMMRTFVVERNLTTTTSTSSTTTTTTTTTTSSTTLTSTTTSPTVTSTPSSSQSTKATQTSGSTAGTSNKSAKTAAPSSSSTMTSAATNKPIGVSLTISNTKNTNTAPIGGFSASSTAVTSLNAKSTALAATTAKAAALSASSKVIGLGSTSAPSNGNQDESFSKGEIFGAAIASGVSAGVLIGVAALVTMGLVFKHSMNKSKRKVAPDEKKKKTTLSEQNELTTSSSPTKMTLISASSPLVPIISAPPASSKIDPVSPATTFVKNPVSSTTASAVQEPVSVGTKKLTTQPGEALVTPNNHTKSSISDVTCKDSQISFSKISTDKSEKLTGNKDFGQESTDNERNADVKSTDESDAKFQSYLRLIKGLAKNKPQNHKHDLE